MSLKEITGREIRLVEDFYNSFTGREWDDFFKCYKIIEGDEDLGSIFPFYGDMMNIYVRDSELADIIKQRLKQMKQGGGVPFKFKIERYKSEGEKGTHFELRLVDKRKKMFSFLRRS